MRTCTVCLHPDRKTIDLSIVEKSKSLSDIAKEHGFSFSAVQRHAGKCINLMLSASTIAQKSGFANQVMEKLKGIERELYILKGEARNKGHLNVVLGCLKEARELCQFYLRLMLAVKDRTMEDPSMLLCYTDAFAVLAEKFPGASEFLLHYLRDVYEKERGKNGSQVPEEIDKLFDSSLGE